jgi:hypothetical protein
VTATPNTALHRTPAAAPPSPVSFQTFGDSLKMEGPAKAALRGKDE